MAESDLSEKAILQGLNTQFMGRLVHYYPTLTSTQDFARDAARAGAPQGTVFVADVQTAGRGRLGRRWLAPPGSSLLLSVVLRPNPELYHKLVMVGSLATARAIEEVTGLLVELKWPNDVLVKGKKVAGLLVEGELRDATPLFAVLGVGINVNLDPAHLIDLLYPAASLLQELGAPVSRVALAQSLLRHLERELRLAAMGEPVHEAWRQRLVTLGKQVQLRVGEELEEGLAEGVDADGRLLLRRSDGSQAVYAAGDVTLQV